MEKKMSKGLFLSVLFVFCLNCFEARAQLKIDGTAGVERVVGTVQTKVEEVTKKVNAAAKKVEESQLGQSIKTKYEAAMALKGRIQANVAAGQELYTEAQKTYTEGQKLYDDTQSFVEQTQNEVEATATGLYEDQMSQLKQSNALSTVTLKKELDDLQAQIDERQAVVETELETKSKLADENMSVLQELYNSAQDDETRELIEVLMAETGLVKQEFTDGLSDQDGKGQSFLEQDEEYQNLRQQYAEKEEQLRQAEEALKQKGMSLATDFVNGLLTKSPQQKKAEYGELISANFVGPDVLLTSETVARVVAQRSKNVKDDTINALLVVINSRKQEDKKDEKIDMIADNVASVDYAVTAQRLLNEQNIEELKVLNENLKLEIAALKLETSESMLGQDYRVQNPDANPGEINLDSYVLDEEQLEKRGLTKEVVHENSI